jgi:hypothetical protein
MPEDDIPLLDTDLLSASPVSSDEAPSQLSTPLPTASIESLSGAVCTINADKDVHSDKIAGCSCQLVLQLLQVA